MSSYQKEPYSVVDLFAGAGGLSYGFLQTGRFSVKAAFENNRNAQKTYKRNHGDAVIYNDITDALKDETKEKLGKVDVVIGGPPCQGFSNANRQKNHAISQNNSLVKKFVQTVLFLQPIAFVMENVSMLQSEIHRFYVDKSDRDVVAQYGISTTPAEIQLLDEKYMFDGVLNIIASQDRIKYYRWDENDYLTLNVVYKMRNNLSKMIASLWKHKKGLLSTAEKLTVQNEDQDYIISAGNIAGLAIKKYFSEKFKIANAMGLCSAIETPIMLQRMLGKAQEILDNHIVVDHYSTEHGLVVHVTSMAVIDYVKSILGASSNGYNINEDVLSAVAFGAPQKRMRFVMIGVKKNIAEKVELPKGTFNEEDYRTVHDAISDLENIKVSTDISDGENGISLPASAKAISELGRQLRDSDKLYNHVSTDTSAGALERFKVIKQGENFHSLPSRLKSTYSDTERTQNTIYLRLKYNEPSGTVVNVRKSMWIHPVLDRAISIREAARLQTFPDSFVFCGTKDSQYQQVGNAVPPILAKAIAEHLCKYLDRFTDKKDI